MSELLISEIFGPTIQGEGLQCGLPTLFVRTGGCDFRCTWCDTPYAVDKAYRQQWQRHSSQAVLDRLQQLSRDQPMWVTLSGGNPALQPLGELIERGQALGYRFALETQGSVCQDWFARLDALTLSPKPPSSQTSFRLDKLEACVEAAGPHTQVVLKIVIDTLEDLDWAGQIKQQLPQRPLVLQPCNQQRDQEEVDLEQMNARMRWLVSQVLDKGWHEVRVLPQLHVYLWHNERGV